MCRVRPELGVGDHLSPPPTYKRAREMSVSDETFFPPDIRIQDLSQTDEEEECGLASCHGSEVTNVFN